MNFYSLLSFIRLTAEESSVIVGGSGGNAAGAAADAAGGIVQNAGLMDSGIIQMVLMYAVLIGAMYFFFFRPNRKKEKTLSEMRQAIRPGDNVVTTSGLYGKVTDVGEDVFVVEFGTNRGIRIPVSKTEVAGIKVPKLTPQIHEVPSSSEADKGKEKKKGWFK